MSRFESRNARYASADINERGGGGGEEENGTFVPFVPRKTRNRKRTYRIENGLDSVSYLSLSLSLFLSPHGPPRAAIREEIDRFYIYIYLLLSSFLLPSLAIRLYNRYSYLGHERQPPSLSPPPPLPFRLAPIRQTFIRDDKDTTTSLETAREGQRRCTTHVHIETYRQLYICPPSSPPSTLIPSI